MGYWNYRLLEAEDGTLAIHEVYYDEEGKPMSCTANPIDISGWNNIQEIADTLEMMKKALRYPILREEDFDV